MFGGREKNKCLMTLPRSPVSRKGKARRPAAWEHRGVRQSSLHRSVQKQAGSRRMVCGATCRVTLCSLSSPCRELSHVGGKRIGNSRNGHMNCKFPSWSSRSTSTHRDSTDKSAGPADTDRTCARAA